MLCDYRVIKKENLKSDKWSGGTTTQLAIYPNKSVYKDKNFIWRLSSATVEDDTSEFTQLCDYNRIIMILDGKLELNHNDKEIIYLGAFDQNEFDGANHTISKGKVIDFNLMMRKDKCKGSVKAISIEKGQSTELNAINGYYENNYYTIAIYNYKSKSQIRIDDIISENLKQGDLLIATFKEKIGSVNIKFENLSDDEEGKIILSQIFY